MSDNGNNEDSAMMDLIRELDKKLRPLEEKGDDITAQKSALRKQFTADTGIVMADFDYARRYANIEDDDMRQGKLRNFVQVLGVLAPSEQLTLDLVGDKNG